MSTHSPATGTYNKVHNDGVEVAYDHHMDNNHEQQQQQQQPQPQQHDNGDAHNNSNNNHHDNDDGHDNHHAAPAGRYTGTIQPMPLFRMVHQRQRWGEKQHKPHGEFDVTFFDLFYVAAAYNLGNLIKEETTMVGILYFVSCFLPLMSLWLWKLTHDVRYYCTEPDLFHTTYNTWKLLLLATAVLYIRPVSILSNPGDNIDMFVFSLCVTLLFLMWIGESLEIVISQRICNHQYNKTENARTDVANTDSQPPPLPPLTIKMALYPEAYYTERRNIYFLIIPFAFSLTATIYSAIQYYGTNDDDTVVVVHDDPYYPSNTTNSTNATSSYDEHRSLAAAVTEYSSNGSTKKDNTAAFLLLAGIVAFHFFAYMSMCFVSVAQEYRVPLNIDYILHRHGEWIMLMMGESVLSLLIVDTYISWDYVTTFVSGVLSIILLQILHFQSQPHDPDKHAMRRSKQSGLSFVLYLQIYSLALVLLGASYKMFLYEYVYASKAEKEEKTNNETKRRLLVEEVYHDDDHHHYYYDSRSYMLFGERILAGSSSSSTIDPKTRQQHIAHLFSGSMAIAFLCMDLMTLAHEGLRKRYEECTPCKRKYTVGIVLFMGRVTVLGFVSSVSQYITKPGTLAGIGLGCVVAQLIIRSIGSYVLFPRNNDNNEQNEGNVLDLPDVSISHHSNPKN